MEIRGSWVTWGDGEAQNMYRVWLWMWVLGRNTTQHRKAAVRFSGLMKMHIYEVFTIKTRLSVAVTNEIKQRYQQKWIFGSLYVFFPHIFNF